MRTPSLDMLPGLASLFAPMSAPTRANAAVLIGGTILACGRRTVTAALSVLGLEASNFSRYHRFFNRAAWSPMLLARLLFLLLVRAFLAADAPVELVVDETLERRRSRKLAYLGLFRDPVRSTARHLQYSWGVRWLCFSLLARVPWSSRRWALPFLVLPLLSEKAAQRLKRPHRTVVAQTQQVLRHLRSWVPGRAVTVVGDGSYAAISLVRCCQECRRPLRLISRLRLDAALYDFPAPRRPGQRGPLAKKGPRQPRLADRVTAPETRWERVTLRWYGGADRALEVATGTALWYRAGGDPVPLRWVLVRSPEGEERPITAGACFCSDLTATPVEIVQGFVGRWNLEVTFEELRAHLGFETQRQWSRQASNRVTPCLFGLFSIVVLLGQALHPEHLPVRASRWYRKEEATFADVLAAVRRHLWQALCGPTWERGNQYWRSRIHVEAYLIPRPVWEQLQQVACYAP